MRTWPMRPLTGRPSGVTTSGGSGIVTWGIGVGGIWNELGVGVAGERLLLVGCTVSVGVASPFMGLGAAVGSLAEMRLVVMLRMMWSTEGGLEANSCALRRGGGRNGEPGDGKGEEAV